MLSRIFWPALGAGCAAGLVLAVMHVFMLTPLIQRAETFETVGPPAAQVESHAERTAGVQGPSAGHGHEDEAWMPADGWERAAYTALATVLSGVGFALLLAAGMALAGGGLTPASGLAWGAAGFAAFALAPALGLPPELPGAAAGELLSRQIWWLGTVAATLVGIAAICLAGSPAWVLVGGVLIVLPHVLGAPHPDVYESQVPAELAGHFVSSSLAANAVFWCILGASLGALRRRQSVA